MKFLRMSLMLLILISCATKSIESHWYSEDITADGSDSDWDESYLFIDNDLKLVYGVSNNERFLNFLIRFQDDNLARRMLIHGFTIWLDKNNNKGIRFEDQMARDLFLDRLMDRSWKTAPVSETPDSKKNWMKGRFYLLDGTVNRDLAEDENSPVIAAASEKDGYYCLEYRICYGADNSDKNFIQFQKGNTLKAELEISSLPDDVKKQMEKQGIERPARKGMGGRGQMPDASMPEGRPGGRRGSSGRQEKYEQVTISLDIILADSAN